MSDNIKGKNQNTIKRRKKRGPAIFDKEMRIKLGAAFGVVIILLVFLIGVIIYKSNVNGDDYARNVLEQQNYSSKVIPYKRGDIVDRNGVLLATSIKVYNLILDPKIILSDDKKYYEDTLDALVECFDYDKSDLEEIIDKYSTRSYYVHAKRLSYDSIKQFLEYMDDDDKNIQGVWFETEYERKYPFSSLACNILGFTSAGNVGTWGIEQQYNNYLNGKDGREYGYVNNDNIMEQVKKNPENLQPNSRALLSRVLP
jgi:stage V sporulation protein D (sporulation-specific penicillin-binding protein)